MGFSGMTGGTANTYKLIISPTLAPQNKNLPGAKLIQTPLEILREIPM
jgi:hypothetical protein